MASMFIYLVEPRRNASTWFPDVFLWFDLKKWRDVASRFAYVSLSLIAIKASKRTKHPIKTSVFRYVCVYQDISSLSVPN